MPEVPRALRQLAAERYAQAGAGHAVERRRRDHHLRGLRRGRSEIADASDRLAAACATCDEEHDEHGVTGSVHRRRTIFEDRRPSQANDLPTTARRDFCFRDPMHVSARADEFRHLHGVRGSVRYPRRDRAQRDRPPLLAAATGRRRPRVVSSAEPARRLDFDSRCPSMMPGAHTGRAGTYRFTHLAPGRNTMRLVTTTSLDRPRGASRSAPLDAQPKKPGAGPAAAVDDDSGSRRASDPVLEDARARDQALRQEGLLLGLDRAQEGARRRERRRREEQAARRVLHGQDALPDELLRGLARVLRQDRPGRRRAHRRTALEFAGSPRSRACSPRRPASSRRSAPTTPAQLRGSVARRRSRTSCTSCSAATSTAAAAATVTSRRSSSLFQKVSRRQRVLHQGQVLRGRHVRSQVRGPARRRRVQGDPPDRRRAAEAVQPPTRHREL